MADEAGSSPLNNGGSRGVARNVVSKVMWVGKATIFMVGLAVVLFLTLAIVAQTADAAKRVPSLKKGVVNSVKSMTTLVGSITDPILKLDNDGLGPALQLDVGSGNAPLVVNADSGTATNLSADELDGQTSTDFAPSTHNHDDRYFTETESNSRFVNETDHTTAAHDALNIDADTLDGKDSTVFAIGTAHSNAKASSCDTAGTHECAPVEIVVPTGKTYQVSVWSSANFSGFSASGPQNVSYCSAARAPGSSSAFCITPSSSTSGGNSSGNAIVTLPQDQFISVSSSGERTLTAGTWMISTLINPAKEFGPACCDDVITKVLVRDVSAPQLSGITRR